MVKNLDSIKKLNPEEIKKNRKIVLNYIGEKDAEPIKEPVKEQKALNRVVSVSNKVDGVKSSGAINLKLKTQNILKTPPPADIQAGKQEKNKREKSSEKAKFEAETKAKAEEGRRLAEEKAKRERLAEKEALEIAKREAGEKAKAEEARKWREKMELEEKIKEEKRKIKENKLLEKIKRAEEIKKIRRENRLSKLKAAKKRKIKRQKAIELFKKNLSDKLRKFFLAAKKNFIYGLLYLIIFLVIGYLFFCLLVLRFKINNNIIERMARFLPIPAAVSSQGIIDYYDFKSIDDYVNLNRAEKVNILAKRIIFKNLSGKYSLLIDSPGEVFALAFVKDEDFNQTGLLRIKKIKELLGGVGDMGQLSKYADEFGDTAYYGREEAIKKFGPAVFNLSANQISDIIFRDNGYYIAQFIDNKNGKLGIKYIFIGAKSLEQYVSEKLAKIKIFILVN